MKSPILLHVALAIAGFSVVPRAASAQPAPNEPAPLIEIYGTIVPLLEYGHTTGATRPNAVTPGTTGASQVAMYSGVNQPARFRMDLGTSNLGFRGGIELVHNLSVIWQIESGVQIDGAPVANTIASRNSNLGIAGSWGSLFFGNWDTPYKWSGLATINPIRAGWIPDYNGILEGPGFGIQQVTTQPTRANASADAAFNRRQGNSVQYWSPTFAGLSARLDYSITEGRTAATATAPSIKPSLFSGSLAYDNGPLKLREAFEAHYDYFGLSFLGGSPGATNTNRSSTDFANQVIAMYTTPVKGFETRVLGVFEYLSYKNRDSAANAVEQFSRPAVYGLIDQTLLGKHHVWLGLGEAFEGSCERVGGATCTTTGLSATDLVLGYIYRASKSTDFFAVAYRIGNDKSASYSTFPALGGPAAPGVAVEAFGVGMLYTFSATLVGKKPSPTPPPPPLPPLPPGPVPALEPGAAPPPTPTAPEPGQTPPPASPPHG